MRLTASLSSILGVYLSCRWMLDVRHFALHVHTGAMGALVMVGRLSSEPREVFCHRGAMENLARTFGAKNVEIWKGENYSQLRKMN